LCECPINSKNIEGYAAKLRLCIDILGGFLTLIEQERQKLSKRKERHDSEMRNRDMERQRYRKHLGRLGREALKAKKVLREISLHKSTPLAPVCSLQRQLQYPVDTSEKRTNHFITQVEAAWGITNVTECAIEVLAKVTEFYDIYRELEVDSDKAFVVHQTVPNFVASGPTSDTPSDDYSFSTYDSCVYCNDAVSVHSVFEQQGVDVATVAQSFAKLVVQEPRPILWIGVSKAGSEAPNVERPGAEQRVSAGSLSNDGGNDHASEGLTLLAARVAMDDTAEPGFRGERSYHHKLGDYPAPSEDLESMLARAGNSDSSQELLATLRTTANQSLEALGSALTSLRLSGSFSGRLSESERLTAVDLHAELVSIVTDLTELGAALSSTGSG
jgi:hypothetical protein